MRISITRRTARITLAAVAGIVFAGIGAGVAHADGPAGTPTTTPTPTVSDTVHTDGEGTPWG